MCRSDRSGRTTKRDRRAVERNSVTREHKISHNDPGIGDRRKVRDALPVERHLECALIPEIDNKFFVGSKRPCLTGLDLTFERCYAVW